MKISIISTTKHSGNTVNAIMIAEALSQLECGDVTLTYTEQSDKLCKYMGCTVEYDMTRSLTQIYGLVTSGAIETDDIKDYLIKLHNGLYLLDMTEKTLNNEQKSELCQGVFKTIPTKFTICDISSEIYDKVTQDLFSESDLVIVCLGQEISSVEVYNSWKQSEYWPKCQVMTMVSQFDEKVDNMHSTVKAVGARMSDSCKLHYNPFIRRLCNRGELKQLFVSVYDKEYNVIELRQDLKELTQYLCSKAYIRFKWRD